MLDGIGAAVIRIGGLVVLNRDTGDAIEKELNERLAGEQWTIENYADEEVTLTVESITVRAKYSPQNEGRGIQQVEGENFFTDLENDRSAPTRLERVQAIVRNEWVSVVRLDIDGNDATCIRPPGLNLHYLSARTAMGTMTPDEDIPDSISEVPGMRVANTRAIQPDRLEMKIMYSGSVGAYRQAISGAIDVVTYIQAHMERYATWYLMELHHTSKMDSDDEFEWTDPERVAKVSEYLYGFVPNLDALAEELEDINDQLASNDEEFSDADSHDSSDERPQE